MCGFDDGEVGGGGARFVLMERFSGGTFCWQSCISICMVVSCCACPTLGYVAVQGHVCMVHSHVQEVLNGTSLLTVSCFQDKRQRCSLVKCFGAVCSVNVEPHCSGKSLQHSANPATR